ncbi:MAG: response regulator [Prevotella sp.]|nr:response regulator [Prevotella sp.]
MRNVCLFVMAMLWAVARPQPQVDITTFDERSGLDNTKVTSMLTDRRGFLWLSTWSGLYRFDGYRFKSFRIRQGDGNELDNSRTDHVKEDTRGNLWVRSYDHIYFFDVALARFFDVNARIAKKFGDKGNIVNFFVLENGQVWMETEGGTRYLLHEGSLDHMSAYPKGSGPPIDDSHDTSRRSLNKHFMRDGFDLRIVDNVLTWTDPVTGQKGTVAHDKMTRTYADAQGVVWGGTENGTLQRIVVSRKPYRMVDAGENIKVLHADKQGNIWQANDDGSVALRRQDGTLRGYLTRNGTVSPQKTVFSRIYCMTEWKGDGTLWMGSRGDGLFELHPDGQRFTITNHRHQAGDNLTLSDDNIYSLLTDSKGRLWVGTYTGGLNLMQRQGGNTVFLNRNNRCSNFPECDRNHCIRSMTQAGNVIVLGTSDGIYTFSADEPPQSATFYHSRRIPDDAGSLSSNEITSVDLVDGHGIIVCTSYTGLCFLRSGNLLDHNLRFDSWSMADGAPSDQANRVFTDRTGHLWVVFKEALSRFPDAAHATHFLTSLHPEYKFLTNVSPVPLTTGETLLGTENGLIAIRLDQLKEDGERPVIRLTGLRVRGESVACPMTTDTLVFNARQRDFTLEFAALGLDGTDNVEYAYIFGNHASHWTRLGTERTISFFDLDAGTYTLVIRATNNSRAWSDNVAPFTIIVKPTFWETPWAKVLYALLLAALAFIVIRIILHINRLRMNVEFEKKTAVLKQEYYTDISHKLRTPLTLIGGPAHEMLADESLTGDSRRHLNVILSNADRMLALVDELADRHNAELVDTMSGTDGEMATRLKTTQTTETQIPETPKPPATDFQAVTLLLVEDDADMRAFVGEILGKEYHVVQAADGQEGLELARRLQPDFIVSDIAMPRMDGWQLVKTLKADPETSHIPIVLLTAKTSIDNRVKGAALGVDDYILKPFSTEYLLMRIRTILYNRQMWQMRNSEAMPPAPNGQSTPAPQPPIDNPTQLELPKDNSGVGMRLEQADREMMQQLRDYMEQNLSQSLAIDDLARHLGLSRTLFYNKLKALTGLSPLDFYRKYHIERAAQMMREQGLTVSEACYGTGFSDPKYFSRVFKKFMGVSPSDYRKGIDSFNPE